jgi:fibronectin-binding autotransporter adhesin
MTSSRLPGGRVALAAAAMVAAASCLGQRARADQYVYTPVNGANDLWSTGINWTDVTTSTSPAVPVSSTSTELTFTTDNTTVFPAGFVDTSTNNVASPFAFGSLDLNGAGPATAGTATININASAGSAGLAPVDQGNINLNANNGSAGGLVYNVNQPLTFGNNNAVFFNGNGTATFNFSGGFTNTNGGFNIVKNGTSTLTISGASSLSGAVYSLYGGTIRLSGAGTLGTNTGVKFYGTGNVLDLNGTNQTVAYLDLDGNSPGSDPNGFVSGTIENNGTGTSTFTINNGYQPVRQNLVDHTNGGTGVLAITTNNNVTLAATNTYSGTTTVNSGTLTVGNGSTAGNLGTGNVVDNGFLDFNRADSVAVPNAISGSGGITQEGTGVVTLSGANSYTNETYVNPGGTLRLGSATALGSAANGTAVSSGGTLDLNGQAVGAEQLTLAGTGVGGVGALINSSATPASLSGGVNLGSANAFSVGGTGNINLSGQIGGYPNASTLTKVGTGTLTISGGDGTDDYALALVADAGTVVLGKASDANTHAIGGGITVAGGLVQLGGSGGDQIYDTDAVTLTSGAFDTNGQSETFGAFTIAGTGIGGAGALVNSAAAASTLTPSSTTLTANTTIGVTQATGSLTLNGTVGNASGGAYGLTKVGAGTLTLTGSNTYAGPTVINGGVLAAGSTQAFGVNSAVTVANVAGAGLSIAGGSNTIGSLTGGGAAGGNVTLGGNTLTIGTLNTSSPAFAGSISGSGGSITKVGTGTLTLAGSSSYTGGTNVNLGILALQATSAAGTGGITINAGGSAATDPTILISGGITLPNYFQVAGTGFTGQDAAVVNVSGNSTLTGDFTVAGSNAGNTYISADAGSLTFAGGFDSGYNNISLYGAGTTTFTGTGVNFHNSAVFLEGGGTYNFDSSSTVYTGSLHLDTGTASFVAGGLGTPGGFTINFGGGVLVYATGNTQDISADINYASFVNSVAQPIAINTNGNNVSYGSILSNTNQGGLNKLGPGTLALNATGDNYTGATAVTGGTLAVNGSVTGTSGVTVGDGVNASSGTLAGGTKATSGQVAAGVTINLGGTITAGSGATTADTVGTLTTGGQTWNAGGTFVNKVAGTTTVTSNDLLVMSSLTLPATGTFAVTVISTAGTPLALPASGSIVLADDTDTSAANPFNATPATLATEFTLTTPGLATPPAGKSYELDSASDGAGGYELILDETTATPEPTSLLLAALAAGPLALGRRRRSSRAARSA